MWGTTGIFTEYNDDYVGQLAAIYLPPSQVTLPDGWSGAHYIQDVLIRTYSIEIPIAHTGHPGGNFTARISCQIYNHIEEYEALGNAINEILGIV